MEKHIFGEKECIGCGRMYSDYPALSRYGHGDICSNCGMEEALTGDFIGKKIGYGVCHCCGTAKDEHGRCGASDVD
jgi:hypothetical protein